MTNEQKHVELLSCPFCSPRESVVTLYFDDTAHRYRVGCGRCGASTGIHPRDKTEAPAIAAWNRRAAIQSQDREDAERYRWLRDTLHGAKAGGGVEVNAALQVYETPEPGEEVRVYWYQDTPVGFYQEHGTTLDEAIDHARRIDGGSNADS